LEVSDAYAEVSSSYLAMETSQAQVDASRERLKSSEALFAADKIQIEFLLDAQEELVRSLLQLSADQTRYTMSLIAVNTAVGSLLADVGIHIQQTSCRSELLYLPATETDVETLPEI
jgi:outer membrane protein TolC